MLVLIAGAGAWDSRVFEVQAERAPVVDGQTGDWEWNTAVHPINSHRGTVARVRLARQRSSVRNHRWAPTRIAATDPADGRTYTVADFGPDGFGNLPA